MSSVLFDEITNDPLNLGYAALLPDSPGLVVELLNRPNYFKVKSLMISERGLMAKLPMGPVAADVMLNKLEVYSTGNQEFSSVVARALKFLAMPDGIDIGEPATQMLISLLGGINIITDNEATEIKNLALQPASRAEVLGLGVVTEQQVREVTE